jgi:hypothetical protein
VSVTTDTIEAIRREIGEAGYSTKLDISQIEHLVWAVEGLTNLVEKLHARVLFLELQQQRAENY